VAVPVVNEFLYDWPERDGGHEFVEICVPAADPESVTVDLDGWNLEYFGRDWRQLGTLDGMDVTPGEPLLVTVFTDGMWNGDEGTAGLRLVDSGGHVVDTVLYGAPNRGDVADDRGEYAEGPDTPADSGASLGRYPDCLDTNVSIDDFVVYAYPTPGEENPALGRDTGTVDSGRPDRTEPPGGDECTCAAGSPLAFPLGLAGAMLGLARRHLRPPG